MPQSCMRTLPRLRPNDEGDFYGLPYIQKWEQICRNCPYTRFFCFTRSWRVRRLWPALQQLHALPNVNLILSVDRDSVTELRALPGSLGMMKAWLAENHDIAQPVRLI